jgi:soluble lytic murein transglycosylase-like protein
MRFCFGLTGCWLFTLSTLCGADLDGPYRKVTSVVRADPRSGRLVRAVVVSRAPSRSGSPAADGLSLRRIVEQTAKLHDVDPLLVHSVIAVESNYNPYAVSRKGAEGLMQLIPSTARRFGVKNSFNLKENITGGVRYLKYLLDLFQDERLALAAYNAGEKAVIRYRGIPPYPETRNYVRLVSNRYKAARQVAVHARPGEKPQEAHPPIELFRDENGRLHIRTY